jgi:hypothetical protein
VPHEFDALQIEQKGILKIVVVEFEEGAEVVVVVSDDDVVVVCNIEVEEGSEVEVEEEKFVVVDERRFEVVEVVVDEVEPVAAIIVVVGIIVEATPPFPEIICPFALTETVPRSQFQSQTQESSRYGSHEECSPRSALHLEMLQLQDNPPQPEEHPHVPFPLTPSKQTPCPFAA